MTYPDYHRLHLTREDGKTTERRENRKGDRIEDEEVAGEWWRHRRRRNTKVIITEEPK